MLQYLFGNVKNIRKPSTNHKLLILKIFCILSIAFVIAGFPNYIVKASSGFKIYDNTTKKTTTYTGNQVKVTYNGTAISKADTPGILLDGIALVSYYDIFDNSAIQADCVYDKAKGTIVISKYNKSITMTIGSKAATVDGKAVTLPVAPMLVKYISANKWKVLVPSRFVSENLGLGYTWYSDKNTVAISKTSIQLAYNGGEKFEYTGAQGKVTIDGKNIDLGSMPSIITNNTAMLRAKKVFSESAIDAEYSFNNTSKKITLTKGNNTLVMTIGSKKAYLNNKELKLDTAPILVTNYETNYTYVMVPGNFTATSLGYQYTWNNSTRTSVIASKSNSGNNSSNTDPELGDDDVINETGTILNQWKSDDASFSTCSGIHELTNNTTTGALGNIYSVSRDYNNIKKNAETFMFVSTAPFSKVTASNTGNLISIQADAIQCTDQTYQMYGANSNYINTLSVYNKADQSGTLIDLAVLPENYLYDIKLSEDGLILYVTVYLNCLTSVVTGVNSAGDYLTLTGMNPLKVNITEESGFFSIDLPAAVNGVGDISTEIIGTDYIKQIITLSSADKTQIIVALNEGYEYYIMESGNQYTLSFQNPEETEDTEDSPDSTDTPGIPEVGDKSKYEIIIPVPAGVDFSAITNEDFYFSNYFVIKIPGSLKDYYNSNSIIKNSKVIDKITVSENGKFTEIKIITTKLQGYELARDNGNLYVNIGDPKEIYQNIVVLDPGHGGAANGAQYFGIKEKDVNFTILYTIGKKYFNSDTSKLKVYYTRTTDVDMTLSNRAAFAQKVGADLFVSLHMNASEASNVYGTEVFYASTNNSPNSAGLTSQKMASIFVNNLTKTLGSSSRGVKQEKYTVIHKNTVPAVLIELGFLSNQSEHAKLTDEEYQNKAAKTIYETLLSVFEDYPTGR